MIGGDKMTKVAKMCRLKTDLHGRLVEIARSEKRSLSKQVNFMLENSLELREGKPVFEAETIVFKNRPDLDRNGKTI